MHYLPNAADDIAIKTIELLIQSGHYKNFNNLDVVEQIGKDAKALADTFTNPAYPRK